MTDASSTAQNILQLDSFATSLLEIPWGSLSKSELEFRVFELLVNQGKLDMQASDVQLAQKLSTTLAKVRALRFRFQQSLHKDTAEWEWSGLLHGDVVTVNAVDKGGEEIILHVKDPFIKEVLTEKLRETPSPVLVRSSLTPGHITVNAIDFWSKVLADQTLPPNDQKDLQAALQKALPKNKHSKINQLLKGIGIAADVTTLSSMVSSFNRLVNE